MNIAYLICIPNIGLFLMAAIICPYLIYNALVIICQREK